MNDTNLRTSPASAVRVVSETKYCARLASMVCLVSGLSLLLEHLLVWNGFELDPIGHETYGLLLVIGGFVLGLIGKEKKSDSPYDPLDVYYFKNGKNK